MKNKCTVRVRRGTDERVEVKNSTFELKISTIEQIKELKKMLSLENKNEVVEKAIENYYNSLT